MACATPRPSATAFVIANWVHTLSPKALFSVAPFYHLNQADYDSLPTDSARRHHLASELELCRRPGRRPSRRWAATASPPASTPSTRRRTTSSASWSTTARAPSQPNTGASARRRPGRVLSLRPSAPRPIHHPARRRALLHLPRRLNESATYPRIGATVEIPRLHWVLRGFYGHFFQPAPLLTVSSSVLNYAGSLPGGENTFTPLPSERDEEHQFGIQIPYKAGSSTSTPSKIASTTSSTTPTSANPTCTSPSPSMERWSAPGK